ncbi:MAG TPA: tetratricopeptide repeat protein [Verrucomicrobiae bacterium]|nr:tetratricopeptide repeat protein [Verrucomicrobiae bacterium]
MNLKPQARFALAAFAIVVLTFAVYWPVVPGTFIMDDTRLISHDNALVNGQLTLRSLWFGTDFTLTTFVWWLEHIAFGQNPVGYHLVNISLQALSAVLLWRLLARLNIPGAWLAAALFAVHPVCVNSVARVAELKNTLSMPFFLMSFIAYLRYENARLYPPATPFPAGETAKVGALWYLVALTSFVLALMAKTTVVMFPVVLLLCAVWQRGRIQWRDIFHTLPFFGLSLAFGIMSIWFQKYQALPTSPLTLQQSGFAQRLAGAGYDFWFYLGKALFPFNLNLEYPQWKIDAGTALAFLPDLLAVVLFVVCLSFRRSWGRHVLFGVGCFAVMLFPALGFFDAQFEALWQVSDHLQYSALPAIVALLAGALAALAGRIAFRGVAAVLLVLWSIYCFKWAGTFSNEENLMTDAVSKNPAAWGALNDLGVIFAEHGDYTNAIDHFQRSVKYGPDNTDARLNFGYALVLQKNYRAAEAQYLAALKVSPREPVANKMYARMLELDGDNREALIHLQLSASLSQDPDTYTELANLDYGLGNWHRVVTDLQQALMHKPKPATELTALNNLAWVLATCPDDSVRNGIQAIQYAEKACRLTGFKQSGIVNTLAAAYAESGRFPDAIASAQSAIKLASAAGDTKAAAATSQLLAQYQEGKPWRDRNGK